MDYAQRLYDWITGASALSCAAALSQVPALVAAEADGADADTMPEFTELLNHIDYCESCRDEYLRQSEA